jgi:disulfide bond formation protein DsbB
VTRLARQWPWGALIASAALLAIAHAFQAFGHMLPCELCLKQRDVYWLAIAIAIIGLAWKAIGRGPDPTLALNALLLAVFVLEVGVAVYHAGVEWRFWPGPAACTGGAMKVDPAELARLLAGARMAAPMCDKPAFVFAGLSMAGWNALAALALTVTGIGAVIGARRKRA